MANKIPIDEEKYLQALDERNLHLTTQSYLNKAMTHHEPYEVNVFGKEILVLPGVMTPKYEWAGLFLIETLPHDFSGKDVLEIGSGTGLVSVFVGLRGSQTITAVDINPKAVENTRMNFERFKLTKSKTFKSDVFANIPNNRFDSIIFNLPYHQGEPQNDLEKGVMDDGYHAMTAFFSGVRLYLQKGGRIYVGFSRSGDLAKFHEQIEENQLRIDHMVEKNEWNDPRYSGQDFHYNSQIYFLSLL